MRWEYRAAPVTWLLGMILLTATPLLISLIGGPVLKQELGNFGALATDHTFREITGFVLFALVAAEISLALKRRTKKLPGTLVGWRSFHMLTGAALIPLVVLHTGGRWGDNLNGALLTCLLLVVITAASGKLVEVRLLRLSAAAHERGEASNGNGWLRKFHAFWLRLHILLVTAMVTLVGFHVLSVYYF